MLHYEPFRSQVKTQPNLRAFVSCLLTLPFLFLQLVDVTWLKEDFLWDRETTSVLWTTRDSMAHDASVVMNSLREKWSQHWAKPITQTVLCVLFAGRFSTCSCVLDARMPWMPGIQTNSLEIGFSFTHSLKNCRIKKKKKICNFECLLFFQMCFSFLCYVWGF